MDSEENWWLMKINVRSLYRYRLATRADGSMKKAFGVD